MKNMIIKSKKILIGLIICLSMCILACGKTENAESENETSFDEGIHNQEKHIQVGQSEQISYNYDEYLYKIWMPEEWGTDAHLIHDTGFSVAIYKIEDNTFVWKIATQSLVDLPCFYYSFNAYEYPNFFGTVEGNILEGSFYDEYGNEGIIRIVLKNKNEIEATFEYIEKNLEEELLALNGTYIMRPYNLKDEENITINTRKKVYLNSWGDVYLAGGMYDSGNRIVGEAFLIDSEENIFYEFGLPFGHGTEITNVYTEDMNGDGLMDVVLYEFFGDDDKNNKEWVVLQREDGLFYSDALEK